MTQTNLFGQQEQQEAYIPAAIKGLSEDATHVIENLTWSAARWRGAPLPFKKLVSTRRCDRRPHVIIAELIMFDDADATLEVFENGKLDGKVHWGGYWSNIPGGHPEFKDGRWQREEPGRK